jgi:hypothetical protein
MLSPHSFISVAILSNHHKQSLINKHVTRLSDQRILLLSRVGLSSPAALLASFAHKQEPGPVLELPSQTQSASPPPHSLYFSLNKGDTNPKAAAPFVVVGVGRWRRASERAGGAAANTQNKKQNNVCAVVA